MSAVLLRDASPEALDAYARQLAREDLAFLIERAIALLDALDGDADLEPSLGSAERVPMGAPPWAGGPFLLGDIRHVLSDGLSSQLAWAAGSTDDREQDGADDLEEPDALMILGHPEPEVRRVRRARNVGGAR